MAQSLEAHTLLLALLLAFGTASGAGRIAVPPAAANDYVGWYEFAPGRHRLVTWGPGGGLRLFDFETPTFRSLEARPDGAFTWKAGEQAGEIRFGVDARGRTSVLHWEEAGASGTARRSERYGYEQRQMRFASGDADLVGTLLLPRGRGPHPAAVIIHGSGDSDRDNVWAFSIANHLALKGVAVLIPDKRGSGDSGGDWKRVGFDALASDALAGVEVLGHVETVERRRIGLVGLSQGGWIAPLAASRSRDVAFVVDVSGATVSVRDQLLHEIEMSLRQAKAPDEVIATAKRLFELAATATASDAAWDEYKAELAKAPPPVAAGFPSERGDWRWDWYSKVIGFDPIPLWRSLGVRALFVFGELDEHDNVPVRESVRRLEELRRERRGPAFTVRVFEGSGHAIDDPRGTWIRRDFLDMLADWVRG